MHVLFYILLMLQSGWCTDDGNFVTKTVAVGEDVTLFCQRDLSEPVATLFWIRVAGKKPEILGKTFNFDFDSTKSNSRITTKQEAGKFVLHIAKTKLSDTAFYYCFKSREYYVSFLNGTFLRIKGPEPTFTAVIQNSLPDAVYEGDPVSLQCSVLSESENTVCPEEQKVFWFRAESDESHPSLIYAQSNSCGECERNPESVQSCVYNFFKDNVSLSDTGTYFCALAACGKVVFGNGTKLEIEVISTSNSEKSRTFLLGLSVTLGIVLLATVLFVCMKKKAYFVCLKRTTEAVNVEHQNQQRNEDSLVYSAVFTQKKPGKTGRKKAAAGDETTYSNVSVSDPSSKIRQTALDS